jgi:hypothetical protein
MTHAPSGRRPKPTDRPRDTAAKPGSGLVVEVRPSQVWEGVTYQLAHNRRRDGSRSPRPYWRAYWHDARRNKTRSKYIGLNFRELTEDEF